MTKNQIMDHDLEQVVGDGENTMKKRKSFGNSGHYVTKDIEGYDSRHQQHEVFASKRLQSRDDGRYLEDSESYAESENDGGGLCSGVIAWVIKFLSMVLLVITFPFSLVFVIKVVTEYERAVIFRLGRLRNGGAKGPGVFSIIPCIDSFIIVDLRTVSFDVPPQEILSKDSVTVSVDAVVYYRVNNPIIAIANVENYSLSTRLLAATTLRNVLGTKNLGDILSERESISQLMQSSLDNATNPWGVRVERVEIKDVRLPIMLQRAMAAEAEATREAKAKVIAADGEKQASHSLNEAAKIIQSTPAALQLRYLQTLTNISGEKNSTIIFPLPIEIMSIFSKNNNDEVASGKSTNDTTASVIQQQQSYPMY